LSRKPQLKTDSSQHRHIPALDGLRAIAVLAVMLSHASYGLLPGGYVGVELFFVLSGFLITRLLLQEQLATGRVHLKYFYLRRLCRLMPALVVTLVLARILNRFAPADALSWWQSAIAALFYFGNFLFLHMGLLTHTWSLSIEEQYYLMWPIVLIFFLGSGNRRLLPACILLAVGGIVILRAWLELEHFKAITLYTFTLARIDGILLGSLLGLVAEAAPLKGAVTICYAWRVPELILVGFAILLIRTNLSDPPLYFGGFTLISASFWLLLLCIILGERTHYLLRALDSPLPRWIGRRSYGLYLYHYPIFVALESLRMPKSNANLVLVTLLRFSVSFGIAAISYKFIEMPFLKRKAHLREPVSPTGGLARDATKQQSHVVGGVE
jgi:peptidoglycan/LPS O-acetylase OafA/YrhL